MSEFQPWPKMARWSRDIIVTEKIDGTNSQVLIEYVPTESEDSPNWPAKEDKYRLATRYGMDGSMWGMYAGSRTRWLDTTSAGDNFGFAKWVEANAEELFKLGEGRHFGEWWGKGIQRGYGLEEKKFSLFNTSRWSGEDRPACCSVVPVLYDGPNAAADIYEALWDLRDNGSAAAPGFMDPEGIIIWHTAANIGFKKTIEADHQPKGQV